MTHLSNTVTLEGNPVKLVGDPVLEGDKAPDFVAVTPELQPFRFSEQMSDRLTVLVAVPSLDTSVCSLEARRFDEEMREFGQHVELLTISMDLPFAQDRWRKEAKVEKARLLSDHREGDFGRRYGVLMEELRLLARSVFIVDTQGVVRYRQLVSEVTQEPDYQAVLSAIWSLQE